MLSGQLVAGRYRLEEQLGAGGMGVVWRATDLELDRVVAVKRAYAGGDKLLREAKAVAALHHPNVITLYDILDDGVDRWLIMEYLQGRDLGDIVASADGTARPLAPAEVAGIGAQVAKALQAVHAIGTLHRDVKPGNILITRDGTAKLCDFGISRPEWADQTLTGAGILGTPAYLAPELANGDPPTAASDLFSLGATLYYAVEGTSPYGAPASPAEVIRRAAGGRILAPRRAGPLAPLLVAMLHRDPHRRPTAGRLVEQLTLLAADAEHSTAPITARRPSPSWSRHRVLALLGAATAVIVLATSATLLVHNATGTPGSAEPGGPVLGMGEQRSADPCALLDVRALGRFGTAKLEPAYGNFNRCDVLILDGGLSIDLAVELLDGGIGQPGSGGAPQQVNGLRVQRPIAEFDECVREIGLPDDTRVRVSAEEDSDSAVGEAPYCAIADAGTDYALSVLKRGQVPRRVTDFPAGSLAGVNACDLLDAPALRRVVRNVDTAHPTSEFGDWECTWHSTPDAITVDIDYDRDTPLVADDGTLLRLAGRRSVVLEEGSDEDYCEVDVSNSRTIDADGDPLVETADIEVSGPQSRQQKCRIATDLARVAAGKLPGRGG